jgi:hypothetical protein
MQVLQYSMKTFPTVEDYLEVIAGKRDIAQGNVKSPGWLGYDFAPIVNLARYDTEFLDSVTDHTLGAGALTDRQADLAVKLISKYQRQLASKGIDTEPMVTPQYRKPLRMIDRSRRCWVDGDHMVLKFPYETKMIQQLREMLQQRQGFAHFVKEEKMWHIALSEFNVNFVVAWAVANQFEISQELLSIMDEILAVEKQGFAIQLSRIDGQLTIENAEQSLLDYLAEQGIELKEENLLRLADLGSELGYTVSDSLWEEVDRIAGADISVFIRKSSYELIGDFEQIPRLFAYAQLVNRLPMIVFDPSASGSDQNYLELLGAENVAVQGNKNKINATDAPVIWTHKVMRELDNIPLLVSHVGLLAGAEKSLMVQNSRKIIYFNQKLG